MSRNEKTQSENASREAGRMATWLALPPPSFFFSGMGLAGLVLFGPSVLAAVAPTSMPWIGAVKGITTVFGLVIVIFTVAGTLVKAIRDRTMMDDDPPA